MPTYAANLGTLWTDLPMERRPAAAAAAGFGWVDIPSPYELDAAALRYELTRRGLSLAVMDAPPPNYAGGARGLLGVPGGEARFDGDLRRALRYAAVLNPRHVHLLAGAEDGPAARGAAAASLAHACAAAPKQGFVIGHGGALGPAEDAAALVREVGAPNLGLLVDARETGGDPRAAWAAAGEHARVLRFADAPGSGEAGLPALLAALEAQGWDGVASASYAGGRSTEETLGWFTPPGA